MAEAIEELRGSIKENTIDLLSEKQVTGEELDDRRDVCVGGELVGAGEVRDLGEGWIHVAMLLSNYNRLTR